MVHLQGAHRLGQTVLPGAVPRMQELRKTGHFVKSRTCSGTAKRDKEERSASTRRRAYDAEDPQKAGRDGEPRELSELHRVGNYFTTLHFKDYKDYEAYKEYKDFKDYSDFKKRANARPQKKAGRVGEPRELRDWERHTNRELSDFEERG